MVIFADVNRNLPARRSAPRVLAHRVLSQDGDPIFSGAPSDGDLGWIWIPFAAAGMLLGGGSLWHLHERQTEKSDRLKCIEKYTDPKGAWRLTPQKAADICSPLYEPKKAFQLGLNLPTLVLVGGSVFALWFFGNLFIHSATK